MDDSSRWSFRRAIKPSSSYQDRSPVKVRLELSVTSLSFYFLKTVSESWLAGEKKRSYGRRMMDKSDVDSMPRYLSGRVLVRLIEVSR